MFTDFCCPQCGNAWSTLGDPPNPQHLEAFRCRKCGEIAEIVEPELEPEGA